MLTRFYIIIVGLFFFQYQGKTQLINDNNIGHFRTTADSLMKNFEYDKALPIVRNLLKVTPGDSLLLFARGFCFFRLNKYDSAVHDFTLAIKKIPGDFNLLKIRGMAYHFMKKWALSNSDLTEAIQQSDKDALVYYYRGINYANLQRPDLSLADLKRAKELSPGTPEIETELLKNKAYAAEQRSSAITRASLLLCQGKSIDAASYQKVSYQKTFLNGEIQVVTVGCDLGFCKPVLEEIIDLHKKVAKWQERYQFNYSVIVNLPQGLDSSRIYASIGKTVFYSKQEGWTFPFYIDADGSVSDDLLDARLMPKTLVIDRNGKIVFATKGGKSTEKEWEELLRQIQLLKPVTKTQSRPSPVGKLAGSRSLRKVERNDSQERLSLQELLSKSHLNVVVFSKDELNADQDQLDFVQELTDIYFIGQGPEGSKEPFRLNVLAGYPLNDPAWSPITDKKGMVHRFYLDGDFKCARENGILKYPTVLLADGNGNVYKKISYTDYATSIKEVRNSIQEWKGKLAGTFVAPTVTTTPIPQKDATAMFPGGTEAWKKYLDAHINADVAVKNDAPLGRHVVSVGMRVSEDGTVSAYVGTKIGYGMEEELIRVINAAQKWIPATKNGRPVVSYFKQSFTFIVEEE